MELGWAIATRTVAAAAASDRISARSTPAGVAIRCEVPPAPISRAKTAAQRVPLPQSSPSLPSALKYRIT